MTKELRKIPAGADWCLMRRPDGLIVELPAGSKERDAARRQVINDENGFVRVMTNVGDSVKKGWSDLTPVEVDQYFRDRAERDAKTEAARIDSEVRGAKHVVMLGGHAFAGHAAPTPAPAPEAPAK